MLGHGDTRSRKTPSAIVALKSASTCVCDLVSGSDHMFGITCVPALLILRCSSCAAHLALLILRCSSCAAHPALLILRFCVLFF